MEVTLESKNMSDPMNTSETRTICIKQVHEKAEEDVLEFARTEAKKTPVLRSSTRSAIAGLLALSAGLWFTSTEEAWFAPLGGALLGVLLYTAAASGLREIFPTPAVRVGRRAAKANVDVSYLYSDRQSLRDYYLAFEWQRSRMRRRFKV